MLSDFCILNLQYLSFITNVQGNVHLNDLNLIKIAKDKAYNNTDKLI